MYVLCKCSETLNPFPEFLNNFATIQMTNPILVTNYLKLKAAKILALVIGGWKRTPICHYIYPNNSQCV